MIIDLNKGNPFNRPKGPGLTRQRILDLEIKSLQRAITRAAEKGDNPEALAAAQARRDRRAKRPQGWTKGNR